MKYYLIAGEASGDLHAGCLMQELKKHDADAEFRFFGGDKMTAVAPNGCKKHYRELAYMGFIPVLLHLRTILRNMRYCKQDIMEWQPDAVILIDYPGFNLSIAKFIHKHTSIPVYYYILPKIWAWKEYRIKNIKRDIDKRYSILPFETAFFEGKHNCKIEYVGNPTVGEIMHFQEGKELSSNGTIALLAGSRKQEIKDNLPMMLEAAKAFPNHQFVIAGAPGIHPSYYNKFISAYSTTDSNVSILFGQTYNILSSSVAALVTSGTATLETALFNVPQVVCYYTPLAPLIGWLKKKILKVKYISLVNLIVNRALVTELVAQSMTVKDIIDELKKILPGNTEREDMLKGYGEMRALLGTEDAAENTAASIIKSLLEEKA